MVHRELENKEIESEHIHFKRDKEDFILEREILPILCEKHWQDIEKLVV